MKYKVMLQVYNIGKAEYTTLHTEDLEVDDKCFIHNSSGNNLVKGYYAKNYLVPYFDMLHEYDFICVEVQGGWYPLYHRHKRQTLLERNYNA